MTFLPEDKETRLRCYLNALRNWAVEGYVEFKDRPAEWIRNELAEYSLREIKRKLFEFVENGGKIAETVETRAVYTSWEFHYDLRVRIDGRMVYFESVLECEDFDDPDASFIMVVSVHDV